MSRWEVFHYRGVTGQCWAAGEVGKLGIKLFFTHAEALAYADQRARTREYVLPRTNPRGEQKIGGTGLYSLHVNHQLSLTNIHLGGWGGIGVEDDDLEPFATYLLAVAEERKRG